MVKKYRISTTISPKHYAMLIRHTEKYGTHQSVIEHAIEYADQCPQKSAPLSREEELWIRMGKELSTSLDVIPKDGFKVMLETIDFYKFREYVARDKPVEFIVEYIYQKPLRQCSLIELIEGLILHIKIQNSYETIDYTDEGDHYVLVLTHRLGYKASKMLLIMHESLFESYGAKTESDISESSIFTKIYKNNPVKPDK